MYMMNPDIILRDIGGIFFLIDITESGYHIDKQIYSINMTGKAIVEIIINNQNIKLDDLVKKFIELLVDYDVSIYDFIYSDVVEYLDVLIKLRYVVRVY